LCHHLPTMLKQKEYDWQDTNMALFGSNVEKELKKHAAESEPAWNGTGQQVEVRVWRINKFKVEDWPKRDYGKFYNGDSYIILDTYKKPGVDDLKMAIHFWIGESSSQDEYAAAAYKTVELDHFHSDKPTEHRQVQGHESDKFKYIFDNVTILEGGCDSGFNNVAVEAYKPRLFIITVPENSKKAEVIEVSCVKESLTDSDSFVHDQGTTITLFNAPRCSTSEKIGAGAYARSIEDERNGKAKVIVVDTKEEFAANLPAGEVKIKKKEKYQRVHNLEFLKLSDASGKMEFTLIQKEPSLNRALLSGDDIFFVDNSAELFVWIGEKASIDERRQSMIHATTYLGTTRHPFVPIEIVKQNNETDEFWKCFA